MVSTIRLAVATPWARPATAFEFKDAMKSLIAKIIGQTVIANVVLGFMLLGGLGAALSLVREGIPEISVDNILIEVAYPGADPYEVEEGISRKIEEAVDGLEGIKRYTTVSIENAGRGIVQIVEGYPMDKALDNVRNAIDAISTFPPDTEKPVISEMTIRSEVIFVALWGDITERVGKEFAEQIKDELQALPGVSQVSLGGVREYEIAIELSEGRLREYGLTFADVSSALRRSSVNMSGARLRTKGEEIEIKATGRKYTGEEFSKIVVLAGAGGDVVTLGQIATVRDSFTEDSILARFNGQSAVMIGVFKTSDEDAIAIARETREYVAKKAQTLPEGVYLTAWNDTSVQVESQIQLLLKNGFFGLIIILCTLWLFMDIRLSFWVAMGIPISLAGAMVLLSLAGGSLNIMSLMGLILVMGIIVDDAIVVAESIYLRRSEGEKGVAAAAHGVSEVALPVLAAVTTTIIAFIPLRFVPSVVGKFVAILPVVVIAALLISLIESLFLLPAHLTHLPDPNRPVKDRMVLMRPGAWIHKKVNGGLKFIIERVYSPFVATALRYRYVVLSVSVAFLIITFRGILGGGFVGFVLFPEQDTPYIQAGIEFPQGTPIYVTEAAIEQTEDALHEIAAEIEGTGDPEVIRNIYSLIGQGANMFETRASGGHFGLIRVELHSSEQRSFHARELIARWQERTGSIPGAITQTFALQEQGPPGAPILVMLKGNDMDELVAASGDLKAKLKTYEGVYQIEADFREGNRQIEIALKPEARALGLTLDDLASQMYAGFYGEEAMRLQRGRDDVRVKVRYTQEARSTLAELESVRIRTPDGHEVPFFSVADVSFGRGVASIARSDGKRSVAVSAEVRESTTNAEEILADLSATFLPGLLASHPGVEWSYEGAKQDSNEAFGALILGFAFAMFGIFAIVAAVFRSYLQPFVILITVPFGITGAIWGHLILGQVLTMFSVFGMVALAGVVVNDAIVLIEAVNTRIARGRPVFDALREGGMRRFRAILLTTISTAGGLAPLIFEKDFGAQMLIPMALSLAAGVIMATVFTLVLIPALMAILNDFRRVFTFVIYGRWPTREEVEPARNRGVDRYEEDRAHGPASEPALVK